MVIYFTGTGNSKYVAERISEKLNDCLIDVTVLIKSGERMPFVSEKPYVFVAPTYAWRMPRVFRDWIKNCEFNGNKKAYFVLTCGGEIGAAGNYIDKFAKKKGFEYMGTADVIMPENYLIMFEPTPKEEDAEIIRAATERAESLCERICEDMPFDKVAIPFVGRLESGIVNASFYKFYIGAKKFYATDACISCGKCADNCIMNNVSLKDGKPTWGNDCTHCLSCICKCPREAIEYGKNTKGRRRYVFGKDK